MSFRQFGGLNYAARHNAVASNYNTSNNLLVTQNVGQPNSFINFESDISGNLRVYGEFDLSGNLFVTGNSDCSGNMNVSQDLTSYQMHVLGPLSSYSDPTSVVPKSYINAVATGLTPHEECICATTPTSGLYGNGNIELSGFPIIDGYQVQSGDRVLVQYQQYGDFSPTSYEGSPDNGIYDVSDGEWEFSKDWSTGSIVFGASTFIRYGAVNNRSTFVQLNVCKVGSIGAAPPGSSTDPTNYSVFGLFGKFGAVSNRGLDYDTNTDILNVDTSLNFINFLDSVATSAGGPTGSNGTLNIGTVTTNDVNIGKTATNNYINFWSGITGPTGSFTQLLVSGNETVGGSLTVTGTGTFQQDLQVNGTLNVENTISASTGTFHYLTVFYDETIGGKLGVSGTVNMNSTLTVGGLITAYNGITGPTGSFTQLLVSGNETVGGTLIVTGTGTFQQDLQVNGTLHIADAVSASTGTFDYLKVFYDENIGGTLGVTGKTTLYNTLTVSDLITASNGITGPTGSFTQLLVSGNEVIQGSLGVTGKTTLYNTLTVSDLITASNGITGPTGSFTQLLVSGNEVIQGTLGVTGKTTLYGNVGIGKEASDNALDINGNIQIGPSITTTGQIGNYIAFPDGSKQYTSASSINSSQWTSTGPTGIYYSGGNVGINTTPSSSYTLDVNGSTNINNSLTVGDLISGPTGSFTFITVSQNEEIKGTLGVTGTSTLYGNVGINTIPSSFYTLDVNGSTNINNSLTVSDLISGPTGSFTFITVSQNEEIQGTLGVTGTSTLYGNVGINTIPSSSYALDVSGNIQIGPYIGTTGNYIAFPDGSKQYTSASNVITSQWTTLDPGIYYEKSVAIGSKIPTSKYALDVSGNINVSSDYYIGGNSLSSIYPTKTEVSTDISTALTDYATKTEVSTDISTALTDYAKKDGPTFTNGITVSSGNIAVSTGSVTATSFNSGSDYRIKENVQSLSSSYTINQLNPVTYYNKQLGKQDIGLIAHEVQEVYPMLVTGEKDGEQIQTINYLGLIPILIKEIQDLKKEVVTLKTEMMELKEKI